MIKSTLGITREPFCRTEFPLLPQQQQIIDMIRIHAGHGGFSVIVGDPGVGKSVIRQYLEDLVKERDTVVASFTQTLHTYQPILKLLAEAMKVEAPMKDIEKALIQAAYRHVQANIANPLFTDTRQR